MNNYKDYNGTPIDYDRDNPDPFKESRLDRYYESQRKNKNLFEDDGDWDDMDYE